MHREDADHDATGSVWGRVDVKSLEIVDTLFEAFGAFVAPILERLDRRAVKALDLLFEFKYVSLAQLKLDGEQVRRYGAALTERYGLTDLRLYAVVGVGLERVVWQAVADV